MSDDAALAARAVCGDQAAFALIVDRHQRAVRAFLRRSCGGDEALADDLAQETFIVAWDRLSAWRGEASLRSWLCAIAWRKASSERRGTLRERRRDRDWLQVTSAGEGGSPDARLTVERALACLPPEQRAAVALCLAADFSHAEAAVVLGSPLGTVKSHVARGRARLAELLGDRNG